jgi:hypothetical protein
LQHSQVGVYDVTVISGATGEPIRVWLTENAFRVPEGTAPVLEDYAKRGWCFAAARISAGGKEVVTPHPLKFAFPTQQAVYPMKLTGVGASPMQLDLYVIGEQAASVAHLDRWSSDRYQPGPPAKSSGLPEALVRAHQKAWAQLGGRFGADIGLRFTAATIGITAGHPDVTDLMWPGCMLTHLRGQLSPPEMEHDFTLDWRTAGPYRKAAYTPQAARILGHSVTRGLTGIALLVIALTWCRFGRRKQTQWLVLVLVSCVISLGAGLAAATLVPRFETGATGSGIVGAWATMRTYSDLLTEGPEGYQPGDEFAAAWAEALDKVEYSTRMGQVEHVAADVPGGYEVEPAPDGWTLTLYDAYATPIRIAIGLDGRPLPKSPSTSRPATPEPD